MVELLLESGALCERDTFQGERCLYNALNDRIRSLLLSYDYSKSTDPLQPLASHITSLLTRSHPQTADIIVTSAEGSFGLHRLILSARSPYFQKKLSNTHETTTWKLPQAIPPQAFEIAVRHLYLGDIPNDIGGGPGTGFTDEEILQGVDKISKQLEIRSLWDDILEGENRRLARQNRVDEVERGRNQLEAWFRNNVVKQKFLINSSKVNDIRWDRDNAIFADVLLRADDTRENGISKSPASNPEYSTATLHSFNGIPIGHSVPLSASPVHQSVIFPAHRAMLLRSEFFNSMFSSKFREAQFTPYLQIVPIACSSVVLEIVLTYLYTERADFPLDIAVDVLFAADLLLIDNLKTKAAILIATLGNSTMAQGKDSRPMMKFSNDSPAIPFDNSEAIDPFAVLQAAWLTRVPRLEEFAARYIAYRLESYIDDPEFAELIRESASRIKSRQETDSIELIDDIRYYLSERFRLRFEDAGIEEMLDGVEKRENGSEVFDAVDSVPAIDAGTIVEGISGANETSKDMVTENMHGPVKGHLVDETVRTLDGEIVGDGFASDAVNYQLLLAKIDVLLERLRLDA